MLSVTSLTPFARKMSSRVADAPTPEPTTPTIQDDVKAAIQYNPELASLPESTILEHAYGICSIAASQPGTDYYAQRADYYSASRPHP